MKGGGIVVCERAAFMADVAAEEAVVVAAETADDMAFDAILI